MLEIQLSMSASFADVVIVDTAGRLAVDEAMMAEIGDVKESVIHSKLYLLLIQ